MKDGVAIGIAIGVVLGMALVKNCQPLSKLYDEGEKIVTSEVKKNMNNMSGQKST